MSSTHVPIDQYAPDPAIRGLLGGPVGFGEITTFLPNNPQVVSAPFGARSNPWTVMGGQSPQSISGAMDDNGSERNIENGLVMQYVARPFKDKKHLNIITGDIVFGLRSKSQSSGPVTMLRLADLNIVLRQGYNENMVRFNEMKESSDDFTDVDFVPESALFGGRWYDKWREDFSNGSVLGGSGGGGEDDGIEDIRNERTNEKRKLKIVAGPSNEFANEVTELLATRSVASSMISVAGGNGLVSFKLLEKVIDENLNMARQLSVNRHRQYTKSIKFWNDKKDLTTEGLRFLYAGSIMDHWNWMGVVRSSTNDTGYVNNITNGAGGKGVAIALTVAKKVWNLTNVFGNTLTIGDKLFLVLKRVQNSTGEWGEFQFIPFSRGRDWPNINDISYIDVSQNMAMGHIIYLGYLSESLDNKVRPQAQRNIASGLKYGQTCREAYDSSVSLDALTCHLKV